MAARRVFIALGSNLGDRTRHIRNAVRNLRELGSVKGTSFLYKSSPMYFADQPAFFNAVAEIHTSLEPRVLLQGLKGIEGGMGRDVGGVRNGPRPIDLDILLYGEETIVSSNRALEVPHPRMAERNFVLRPLCDIDPDVLVPVEERGRHAKVRAGDMLRALHPKMGRGRPGEGADLVRVLPLKASSRGYLAWDGRPKFMGIINATPDSFSDGGAYRGPADVMQQVEKFVDRNFDIIDVGGHSTRPGARPVPVDEERARVEPIVCAIRREHPDLVISVDTFRADVAKGAVDSGVDMVNDVSAGTMDEQMFAVVRDSECSWGMMHMRGNPQTMQSAEMTSYGPDGVGRVSARELSENIRSALLSSVPRWDVLADPGIGFAKRAEQSLAVVRGLTSWKQQVGDFPCIVGHSRKSSLLRVIEKLKDEDVANRDFASAGAAIAAVHAGANILRVHNPFVADAVRTAYDLMQGAGSDAASGDAFESDEHVAVRVSEHCS